MTSGPASDPRPASSAPATYRTPSRRSNARRRWPVDRATRPRIAPTPAGARGRAPSSPLSFARSRASRACRDPSRGSRRSAGSATRPVGVLLRSDRRRSEPRCRARFAAFAGSTRPKQPRPHLAPVVHGTVHVLSSEAPLVNRDDDPEAPSRTGLPVARTRTLETQLRPRGVRHAGVAFNACLLPYSRARVVDISGRPRRV